MTLYTYTKKYTYTNPKGFKRQTNYLLLSGILLAQLLKEPETKTSLAPPFHVKTVGLLCAGFLVLLSRSRCQARNSCISCGALNKGDGEESVFEEVGGLNTSVCVRIRYRKPRDTLLTSKVKLCWDSSTQLKKVK